MVNLYGDVILEKQLNTGASGISGIFRDSIKKYPLEYAKYKKCSQEMETLLIPFNGKLLANAFRATIPYFSTWGYTDENIRAMANNILI